VITRPRARRLRVGGPAVVLAALAALLGTTPVIGGRGAGSAPGLVAARRTLSNMPGMVMATAAAPIIDPPTLVREGWTATASMSVAGHPADAVLDGKASTYWESQSPTSRGTLPQWITIDMRGPQEVSGLTYEPRQGAHPVGEIGRFAVSVSTDGVHFGAPIATGTWAPDRRRQAGGLRPRDRPHGPAHRPDDGVGYRLLRGGGRDRPAGHPSRDAPVQRQEVAGHLDQPGQSGRVGTDDRLPPGAGRRRRSCPATSCWCGRPTRTWPFGADNTPVPTSPRPPS
jgi:hypothetical protein